MKIDSYLAVLFCYTAVAMSKFIVEHKRSHYCGELRASHVGQRVVLFGWVAGRRDLGGRIFIDLRDRSGLSAGRVRPRYRSPSYRCWWKWSPCRRRCAAQRFCIAIRGQVVLRTASGANRTWKLPSGEIEVEASELQIFSR